ncbi:MAG: hypothetical protein WC454_07035 [Phycisphaerae bacterium]|jgi:hypothetical protein
MKLIMPNKANFQNAKNACKCSCDNDYEQKTMNNELLKTKPKQTQTKPNLSAYMADKFALSLPNGPIENSAIAGKIALPALGCRYRGSAAEGLVEPILPAETLRECFFNSSAVPSFDHCHLICSLENCIIL